MREGWRTLKLSKVCSLVNGRAYKKTELLSEGRYPVLRVGNLFTNKQWYYSDLELDEDKYCDKGDLIYAWSASFGPKIWEGDKVIYHYHIWKILPDFDNVTRDFLYHLFEWDKEQIKSAHGTGTTMMHVGKSSMENRLAPIPPLTEQKQIVAILDEAFTAIDQAKANIEKNIQNAKELFQSKLNDIFSQKGDGWEEKTLKEIAKDFGRGKSKNRPRNDSKLFGGKYPFVQTGDVRNTGKILTTYSQTYNEVGLAQSKLWPKGTICITIAANIAETAILDFDSCFPDSIIGLVVDSKLADSDYTYFSLQFLKGKLQELGKGSAQDNINLGTFQKQYFPFPNIKRQKEIVLILDKISLQTNQVESKYQQKLIELEELKKSILKKAFAGELTNKMVEV
jgi:type I restriction enzyme S subunit